MMKKNANIDKSDIEKEVQHSDARQQLKRYCLSQYNMDDKMRKVHESRKPVKRHSSGTYVQKKEDKRMKNRVDPDSDAQDDPDWHPLCGQGNYSEGDKNKACTLNKDTRDDYTQIIAPHLAKKKKIK